MKSVGQKLEQVHGLTGTKDLRPAENNFILGIYERTTNGTDTSRLSSKQVEWLNSIY